MRKVRCLFEDNGVIEYEGGSNEYPFNFEKIESVDLLFYRSLLSMEIRLVDVLDVLS